MLLKLDVQRSSRYIVISTELKGSALVWRTQKFGKCTEDIAWKCSSSSFFLCFFIFCLCILHRSVARGVRHRAWLCAASVQFKTNPAKWEKGREKMEKICTPLTKSEGECREEREEMSWGVWRGPHHAAPHPFSSLLHLLCPWQAPPEEAVLPLALSSGYPSTSELSPLIFQWNVAGAPLLFSLGCGHAVLAASWMNSTWPTSPQPLCLFFPFIPPLLLSPSVMEKQFRFSRFTERGTGAAAASNKCFSNSPQRGNSSMG